MNPKDYTKPFYIFFLMMPMGISNGFVTVALPFLLTRNGFSVAATAGVIALGLSANLWRFLWGPVVDISLSLRKWFGISLLISTASILLLCLTPFTLKGTVLLSAIVFISQVAATFMLLPVNGVMAFLIPENKKGQASGWYQAGSLAGTGLGGGAGLWIATHYSVMAAGIVLCIASVVFALVMLLIKDIPHNNENTLRQTITVMGKDIIAMLKIPAALFAIVLILMPIGTGAMANLWSAIAQDWKTDADTVVLVTGLLSGLVSTVGCVAGGYIADRWGIWAAYLGSGVACAAVTLAMAVLPYQPFVYIAGVLTYAFTTGLIYAAFTAVLLFAVGKKHVATKFSLLASLGNVPVVYMTAINGWVHDKYSSRFMLSAEAITGILFVIIFFFILRQMKYKKLIPVTITAIFILFFTNITSAQTIGKEQVPAYTLPDPLKFNDGSKVKNKKQWEIRRAEILEMCENEMYGRSPGRPANMKFTVFDTDEHALDGKATRKQITISFTDSSNGPKVDVLVYYPNQVKGRIPVFLDLNFQGNHAATKDPAVRISPAWVWAGAAGVVNNHSTEASRGSVSSRWPVEMILERGYAAATVFANEIDPDFNDGFKNGVHALYPELQNRGDNFSTIGAWAWGLSRVMDYLETDPKADAKQVMLFGFSRMGKAALWAGAKDRRFAMVISNESGGGGAALSKRIYGEDVERLTRGNPHWFCANFKKYNHNEAALPFDQHMVVALIAPRPVYIASAELDTGADPYGEFLTAKAADPVYRFLGAKGFPADTFPALHQPIFGGSIAYHIRAGKHDVTNYDWEQYMNFADQYFKRRH